MDYEVIPKHHRLFAALGNVYKKPRNACDLNQYSVESSHYHALINRRE